MKPPIAAAEEMIGHGLDADLQTCVRKIIRRGSKKVGDWRDQIGSNHAANSNDAPANDEPIRLHHLVQQEFDRAWSDSCGLNLHAEQREAFAIAEQVTRAMIRDLLPASAMLYVPADESAAMHAELSKAVYAMVEDLHKTAKTHGEQVPFCKQSFERDLKHEITRHIKGSKTAKAYSMRHNPAEHHAPYVNASSPENGGRTIAQIISHFGGIDHGHGLIA